VNGQAEQPVVASYCATFLKPEMLHIYRQITGLKHFRPIVIAQKREETERFPFDDITIVAKPSTHFLRRIWYRQLRDVPWQISRGETNELLRVLEGKRAALLHVYFGHIAVHLLPLMRAWKGPTVVSFHGADVMVDLEKPAYRAATLQIMEAARLVLVRSESLRKTLVRLGAPANKIRIQRTGVPLQDFPFRTRLWPADGAWQLLQACRLIEKKGLQTSLRAFAAFVRRFPQSHFTIAGDGPLLDQLQRLTSELQIADRVNFPGFVSQEELRELYYHSHIFLHPSETGADGNQEGVPNSMLEAMATGLPVFATTHGGIPEAIASGASGVLVSEGDDKSLGQELLKAAEQAQLLTRLAENGAKAVAEKFEQGAQIQKLEDFYSEAMAV
jgi:colanic acid/amylovoran biosynthesis glycosyltransferase